MKKLLLTGTALWCSRDELIRRNRGNDILFAVTGMMPFHRHRATVMLTGSDIELTGSEDHLIPLGVITQLYIGFDEYYTRGLVKNLGLFTQPLRIAASNEQTWYFFIDYGFWGTSNKIWFEQIKSLIA
ncbi:MAG: hypothetical protein J7539_13660 [Niabella sp.]|nr:hypothetical protein [Niabella sp.]